MGEFKHPKGPRCFGEAGGTKVLQRPRCPGDLSVMGGPRHLGGPRVPWGDT